MARPLVLITHHYIMIHDLPFISYLYGLIAVLSIFSLVVFLCGNSNTTKKSHGKIGKEINNKTYRQTRLNGTSFGGKAFSVVKTIHPWRKLQEDDDEETDACGGDDHDHQIGGTAEDDDDDEVWRKPIMRGERCRPLDFSGNIVYDSMGNIRQESPK